MLVASRKDGANAPKSHKIVKFSVYGEEDEENCECKYA